jgi:hypothetical protein
VKFLDLKPITCLQTDACLQGGAGYYEGDFFYVNWDIDLPQFKNYHTNIKETMAIVLSVIRWGHLWTNKSVVVFNMTTKCIINKDSSRNKILMTRLRELFWLSAIHNFDIKAKFISGRNNVIADSASRLHEQGLLSRLYDKLVSHSFYIPFTIIELLDHMSFDFFIPDGGTRETQVLEDSVCRLKSKGWAKSTSGTYRTHLKTYLEFCGKYDLEPVPCTTKTVELYITFLVDVKKFALARYVLM